jgi:hypothetical protein
MIMSTGSAIEKNWLPESASQHSTPADADYADLANIVVPLNN